MNDPDNVKMDINIAGERILLTVPSSLANSVRNTERSLNRHFTQWRRDFPNKTDKELLAMLAYQYASFYNQLNQSLDDARQAAGELDSHLDSLIG